MTSRFEAGPVAPPNPEIHRQARERLAGLATPAGALGRLGDLGAWLAAAQGQVPPWPLTRVRTVIFAGDHGVSGHGVSAYPAAITPIMVRTFAAGRAGVNAIAAAHDVGVRVLDLGVDDDLSDLDPAITAHKVCRGSGAIHLEDALSDADLTRALDAGAAVARDEIAAGADLLISGDMGIGNTTPAAALIAAALGLDAAAVAGTGTGVDADGLARKTEVIAGALERTRDRHDDPRATLAALGSADLAASAAFIATAADAGVPVLLDGVISVACALTADRLSPGAAAWCLAGHRSPEPAQALALAELGLTPLLDLGMRLGEGSGAVAAVPVLRSAIALMTDVALLADLLPPDAG